MTAPLTRLHETMDTRACRALWAAVLTGMLRDFCGMTGDRHQYSQITRARARETAEAWIGSFPRKDFRMVCEGAGLEADAVHDRLHALMPLSPSERRQRLGRFLGWDPRLNRQEAANGKAVASLSARDRRDQIASLFRQGVAPADMPATLAVEGQHVAMTTVYNDLKHLRAEGRVGYARGPIADSSQLGRAARV